VIALPSLAKLASAQPAAVERCELCSTELPGAHRHVVEVGKRGVLCACHACALLFAAGGTYKAIPNRVKTDPAFALSPSTLGIPVGLAFVYRSAGQTIVSYPGPAGIIEGELDAQLWDTLAAATPLARELSDDVEALLVRKDRGSARASCHLVPISTAYELAALLRASWQGFSGGPAVEAQLAAFFAELDRQGGRR
jgi:hypothetical protein